MKSKATSPRSLHRATFGSGGQFATHPFGDVFGDDRNKLTELVKRYTMWVHRCVTLNSQLAASVDFKLFSTRAGSLARGLGGRHCGGRLLKNPSPRMKRYLRGDDPLVKPSPQLRRKFHVADMDDLVEIDSHPVLDLLHDVNPWTDGCQYREGIYSDMQWAGRAFDHLITDRGRPTQLWRMGPEKVKVVPSTTDFVSAFEFGYGPDRVVYRTDEVLWYRQFDPWDPLGGLGPLEAWMKTVDSSVHIQQMQWWLFERLGMPDFFILADEEPEEPDKRAFRAQFRRFFGRLSRRLELFAWITGKPRPEIVPATFKPTELEFKDSADQLRDFIGQAFGVPKSVLTTDDVNRANARESDAMWVKTTIWPLIQKVEAVWNERLLPMFGENLVIIHENPVPDDRELLIQERKSKLESGWSVNKILDHEGEEQISDENADKSLIGQGLGLLEKLGEDPLGGLFDNGSPREQRQPQPSDDEPGDSDDEQTRAAELGKIARKAMDAYMADELSREEAVCQLGRVFSPAMAEYAVCEADARKERAAQGSPSVEVSSDVQLLPDSDGQSVSKMWSEVYDGSSTDTKQEDPAKEVGLRGGLDSAVRNEFRDQLQAVAGVLEAMGLSEAKFLLTDDRWVARMAQAVRPVIERTITLAGQQVVGKLPAGLDVGFDVTNPAVEEFVSTYTIRLARQIQGRTQFLAEEVIGRGLEGGASVREIASRIRQMDASVSEFRATMIARTETTRAFMEGQRETMKNAGVAGKRWILAPNACEFCEALSKEYEDRILKVDEPFYQLGHRLRGVDGGVLKLDYAPVLAPPLHPHCRCDLEPVLE